MTGTNGVERRSRARQTRGAGKSHEARRRVAGRISIVGILSIAIALMIFSACATEPQPQPSVVPYPVHVNPDTGIEFVAVDRFSDEAGTLMRRSEAPNLPAPNEPIDYDSDFLRHSLGPDGQDVSYYMFDVSSLRSAPVYVFVYASDQSRPVEGQSPIFDLIPGEDGYNDFWQKVNVLVPDDYEPDSVRSLDDVEAAGFELVRTGTIINCPIVPYGSTAELAEKSVTGWYKGKHVSYFIFDVMEASIVSPGPIDVPYAVVRVIFEDNDPAKGMKIDPDTGNTRNVFDTLPGDKLYRSLWRHDFVDEAEFDSVSDWKSSKAAREADIDMDNILVNCPVVIWPDS